MENKIRSLLEQRHEIGVLIALGTIFVLSGCSPVETLHSIFGFKNNQFDGGGIVPTVEAEEPLNPTSQTIINPDKPIPFINGINMPPRCDLQFVCPLGDEECAEGGTFVGYAGFDVVQLNPDCNPDKNTACQIDFVPTSNTVELYCKDSKSGE